MFKAEVIFLSFLFIEKTFARFIGPNEVAPTESGTWNGHWAYLAIDGDPETFCVASASSLVPEISVSWWEVDFSENLKIAHVDILSSPFDFYARQLENFAIYIYFGSVFEEPGNIFVQRCASYVGQQYVLPSTSILLNCQTVINGRFLIITKFPNASYPGLLSMAEVTIDTK